MYVINVGNNLYRRDILTYTCFYTLVIVHTLALFATTEQHTNTLSSSTFSPTLETNRALAINAIILVQENAISPYTYAHTQGRNLSPVMCEGNHSHKVVL